MLTTIWCRLVCCLIGENFNNIKLKIIQNCNLLLFFMGVNLVSGTEGRTVMKDEMDGACDT